MVLIVISYSTKNITYLKFVSYKQKSDAGAPVLSKSILFCGINSNFQQYKKIITDLQFASYEQKSDAGTAVLGKNILFWKHEGCRHFL